MKSLIEKLKEKYPFISFCTYGGEEYVGIIQHQDNTITAFYDYGGIADLQLKKRFIELGTEWWEESNRQIPINIFLKTDWDIFKPYLKTFINRDLVIIHGPCTSLHNLSSKRVKRRSITLVRKV
jgi:hypothetical protein